ncbi:trypsin-like peptidase domain-containing protein [Streptomyces sp. NPDC015220]|uniref:trypsin-like peptidase domain-containing protein n=1 Tax=Streptomyces sp. NPDC015220 TaxID=3364947 RepID=UPI0036FB3D1F
MAEARDRALDGSLVCIRDLAGRPRGTGFAADHHGTVLTSHEAVDGLARLVLHAPGAGGRSCVVTADAVTALPELDLALVRTEGLGVEPLPVTTRAAVGTGAYVRIAAGGWREARVLGPASVAYTAMEGRHLLDGALELAIGTAGRDALRRGGGTAGGPVLDAATGTVVAVLGTALRSGDRESRFAVPLRPAALRHARAGDNRLADLLARNAATVPAYGPDLNLAGVLELTATAVAQDGPRGILPDRPHGTVPQPFFRPAAHSAPATIPAPAPAPAPARGARTDPGRPDTVPDPGRRPAPARPAATDRPAPRAGATPPPALHRDAATPDAAHPARPVDPGAARPCPAQAPGRRGGTTATGDPGAPLRPADAADLGGPGAPGRPVDVVDLPVGTVAPSLDAVEPDGPDSPAPGTARLSRTVGGALAPDPAGPDPTASAAHPGRAALPVERSGIVGELAAFAAGPAVVLGLVGAPGSGRTTELVALAGRRARGDTPTPTLWLRGADLDGADTSVADAACRALDRAARIVAAAREPLHTESTDLTPERVARLAHAHGRPLLLLLDGPEEMPSALAHRLAEWTRETAQWLRSAGARLVVACREEYWEHAGALVPPGLLHAPDPSAGSHGTPGAPATPGSPRTVGAHAPSEAPATEDTQATQTPPGADVRRTDRSHDRPAPGPDVPAGLRLGDLTADEAREARSRYGIPDGALVEADARHPLTLRLLSEVRAALPDLPGHPPVDRADVLAAHLDLMCLRIAVRLAAENDLRGSAVRRLAAKVSGQVHEAARRSLGPGHGELDRGTFEDVFPWGPAPARLGGGTGWASAVLTEGLLVPAGDGYRFAHEEVADWLQGTHLDLDEALRVLVHRRHIPGEQHPPPPVSHHRIGPVVQALMLLARQHGTRRLAVRLEELVCALDTDPHSWWASRLLAGVLLRVPDAAPYAGVLRLLAEWIVARQQCDLPVPGGFGPGFWTALHLSHADRCDLLRRLLLADRAPQDHGEPDPERPGHGRPGRGRPGHGPAGSAASAPGRPGAGGPDGTRPDGSPPHASRTAQPPRYLDAVARLLAADPVAVQPHLTRWFDDERPLPAAPHATVATAAQALLHTHRHRAPDDLVETLVACPHERADELLAALAEEEPATLCRAVGRWAHDDRSDRRAAAVTHGLRTAPHVRTETDRELLRDAAFTLLARPADAALHGGALALLVQDPHTRARHLPQALRHFAAGDPNLPPDVLAGALTTHPDAVLASFGGRMRRGPGTAEALRALADVITPALAPRLAALAREAVERRPDLAGSVAAYVDRRLRAGPAAHAVMSPLVTGLLEGGAAQLRAALGGVLAASGAPACRALRRELLGFLLDHEEHPAVLEAVLYAAVPSPEGDLCDLVHRVGLLLVRTPEGAAVFDRALLELGRHVPGFAVHLAGWLSGAPQDWAALVGPSARRTIGDLAGAPAPA